MRSIKIILGISILLTGLYACEDPLVEGNFEDQLNMTIYDYIVENDSLFGPFFDVLEAGTIAKTLSAYNPYGDGYTLFLPDSMALMEFIAENNNYNTMEELLNDEEYVSSLSRYHVVELAINANDFPFGALPAYTLSQDYLTISFVSEPDTSYYKINNQAPVIVQNIELSNGYIHRISKVLNPVTYTTYEWLTGQDGFEIFTAAVDLTGFEEILSVDLKDSENESDPLTLLMEPDSVYNRSGIYSVEDLAQEISPDDADYTNPQNPLYSFVAYHILSGTSFLDDFADVTTNYSTLTEIPLSIDGEGIDLAINKGKVVFDTIIDKQDTTIIDYVGFYYDISNVLTKSGAIHFIDQVLEQQIPTQESLWFSFWEEQLFNEFREEPGEYFVEDPASLKYFTWSGADLVFVKSADEEHPASNQDYIFMDGDFSISYELPKIVQGNYTVSIRADRFNEENALVEILLDGKKLGGLIDLSTGGSTDYPFGGATAGTVNFVDYSEHTITIRSLIPGMLSWDHVSFIPITNEFEK